MHKFFLWTAGLLFFTLVCVAVGIVYVALKAEERFIAVARTTVQAEAYLKETSGLWPKSWKALFPDSTERIRIQQFVEFDFSANLSDIAGATPNQFQFIRPIGPCSKSYEWQILLLIDTAKTIQRKSTLN